MKYFRSPQLFQLSAINNFEIIKADSIQQAKDLGADFIDLTYADYVLAQEQFSMSEIDVYSLGAADCLLKIDERFQFYQLSQKALLKYLAGLKLSLQTAEAVVIVGDQLTISQFLPALTKLGYSKFIFVVENKEAVIQFSEKIQKTFLSLSIQILQFKQISLIETVSSFLLVDIDHKSQTELVESLTYFNFLSTGSLFFDVRSLRSNDLVQEALRAQMSVVDSKMYDEIRFELADQILTKKIK